MFYLGYVRSEFLRRRVRTILTLAGLAICVALVLVIAGVSRGLEHAQKTRRFRSSAAKRSCS